MIKLFTGIATVALVVGISACQSAPQRAQEDALTWIAESQNPEGSWGTYATARYAGSVSTGQPEPAYRAWEHASCSLVIMSLCEAWCNTDDVEARKNYYAQVARAVTWMADDFTPIRSRPDIFYDVWAHAFSLQLAARLKSMPEAEWGELYEVADALAERALTRLAEDQSMPGGWGYYDFGYTLMQPSGDYANSFVTATVLLAMLEAEEQGYEIDPVMIRAGYEFLTTQRSVNHGFVYSWEHRVVPGLWGNNHIEGSMGRIGVCHLALYRGSQKGYVEDYQMATTNDLLRALQTFEIHRPYLVTAAGRTRPHEVMHQNAGYYVLYGHYYIAQVCQQLSDDGNAEEQTYAQDFAQWLLDEMIGMQGPDGAYFDFPILEYARVYATGFGLMSLQTLEQVAE